MVKQSQKIPPVVIWMEMPLTSVCGWTKQPLLGTPFTHNVEKHSNEKDIFVFEEFWSGWLVQATEEMGNLALTWSLSFQWWCWDLGVIGQVEALNFWVKVSTVYLNRQQGWKGSHVGVTYSKPWMWLIDWQIPWILKYLNIFESCIWSV